MKRIDVAIAIIVRGGQVLICQRGSAGPFPGLWEFPGGKCDPGEDPALAVQREIQEELGVRILPHSPMAVIDHDYPDLSVRLHPFVCSLVAGDPQPLSADRLQWVDAANLSDHPFPAANADLVRSVRDALRGSSTTGTTPDPI
jgi:mutator protein MutT